MTSTQNIQNELKRLGNKQIAEHSQRFFKTGKGEYGESDQFLGIRVPILRKLVKQFRGVSFQDAFKILDSPFHEQRLFALLMLVDIAKRSKENDQKAIYTLYLRNIKCINNWDLVDSSAEHIVGAYLRTRDKKPLYSLARSKNLWKRRIAIMATFHYIKHNEFKDALIITETLLNDEQDLIHKAVGWMLREIGKRDLAIEEEFLKKYYKIMPRTMLRYAIEKFPEDMRKKYLKGEV